MGTSTDASSLKDQTKIKAVAFDFDGTLADSFPSFVCAVAYALGRQPFTTEEVEELRQHSVQDVIKILNVKNVSLPWLLIRCNREIARHESQIVIFAGIAGVLERLSRNGYKLYIVSSHSKKDIRLFLERYQLGGYIDHVYARVGLWGKPKKLKKILNRGNFTKGELVFVGDEIRDIEAAKQAGTRCVAVAWGFNGRDSLKLRHPSKLVDKPEELITALQEL